MKRHEALAPLSRDHHGSLILAQLLKKGTPEYKGLPADNAGKLKYAMQQFEQHIKKHFEQEENILKKAANCNEAISRLGDEIVYEHEQLVTLFLSLEKEADPEAAMDKLGRLLETHIRKEERSLFPLMQQYCPESILQQIHKELH